MAEAIIDAIEERIGGMIGGPQFNQAVLRASHKNSSRQDRKFTGTIGTPIRFPELLREMEVEGLAYGYTTDKERVDNLALRLTGNALQAFINFPPQVKQTYEGVIEALKHRFPENRHASAAYVKLQGRRLQPGERGTVYAEAIRELAEQAFFDIMDEDAKLQLTLKSFALGLPRHMRQLIAVRHPETLEDAVQIVEEMQAEERLDAMHVTPEPQSTDQQKLLQQIMSQQNESQRRMDQQMESQRQQQNESQRMMNDLLRRQQWQCAW